MNTKAQIGAAERSRTRPAWRWVAVFMVAFAGGTAVTVARVDAALRQTRLIATSDGATILAMAGVRDFSERADIAALMLTPVGADSMVMKAKVFVGDESMGTYTVRVIHVGTNAFRLRSTGRLKSGEQSVICSLDVLVQIDEKRQPGLGIQQQPLCNGSRHESAVTRVNIGS